MNAARMFRRSLAALSVLFVLVACRPAPPQALGTLEFDRITLPAPAAERVVAIDVREGERVAIGQSLLQLDPAHTRAELAAAQAQARQQRELLAELETGPRREDIDKARANLAAAQAQAREARALLRAAGPAQGQRLRGRRRPRPRPRHGRQCRWPGGGGTGRAGRTAARHPSGADREARAALAAADAQVGAQQVLLGKLAVVAPRAGRIDSLPYKLGDQAPVGAPLAILLAGDAPYARIYVPVQQRAGVRVGDPVRVFVAGRGTPYAGKVRMIRSEPDFTPYYALIGDDAARLSYLAEVALGADAAELPAGLPVHAEFRGAAR
ncbi:HlyD family efflux transporter periplasmic adaptor subunit [Rhodanobacter sp. FW510-T8]